MPKPAEQTSSFPHWVTWLSLGGALLLFFGNTVPAMRERKALQGAQQELLGLRQSYADALTAARLAAPGSKTKGPGDLQSVLVAIDRLGWTPEEVLRHFPEPTPRSQGDHAADRDANRATAEDERAGHGPGQAPSVR